MLLIYIMVSGLVLTIWSYLRVVLQFLFSFESSLGDSRAWHTISIMTPSPCTKVQFWTDEWEPANESTAFWQNIQGEVIRRWILTKVVIFLVDHWMKDYPYSASLVNTSIIEDKITAEHSEAGSVSLPRTKNCLTCPSRLWHSSHYHRGF